MRNIKMNDYKRKWDNCNRRWVYEHREVATQKLGRELASSEQVHHIDGNILNNKPSNLYVGTIAEHCHFHHPARYRRKLTAKNVAQIRALRKGGMLLWRIGSTFGVHEATISRIYSGVRW